MPNQIFENNNMNGTGTTCEGPRPLDVPQNSSGVRSSSCEP